MFYYSQDANSPSSSSTTTTVSRNENKFLKPNMQQHSPLVNNLYPNMCSSPYLGNQFTPTYNDSIYSSGYSSANSSFNNQSLFRNSPLITITNQNYNFINQTTVSDNFESKHKFLIRKLFIIRKTIN
jgi:hypothetical protein